MDETPISVLLKQIKFYNQFINSLTTKEGIDENASQKKLNKLIKECKIKIKEFKRAIKILKEYEIKS